ncbi:hypothetical protein QN277_000568 [Acacia crassicarpa]|uniref:HMA domain-containing protein n=1 Tax=Acacia crassicarpa TaxID=499986 RepID=A0AAE1THA0_9FABA|nr:hypothetical protein QN277_000568 [Acacia crassicarpa]
MNKEEIEKIYKCHLKVNIHCDGCKHKVKKVLRKIDGVFIVDIDSEQGKVTVSGNVEPNILIKKLVKSGKHAELWDAPKASNNNNNENKLTNQMKNKQIDNGEKDGGRNKKDMQKVGGNNKGMQRAGGNKKGMQKVDGNNQPKGSQKPPTPQQRQQQQLLQQQLQEQQLQKLQQMKALQDQKMPLQFKDMQLLGQPKSNPKAVKFNLPKDDDCSDDEFDDDEDFDDDDDEIDEPQALLNKMKGPPPMGNGAQVMMNSMVNGNQHQQLMNALKNSNTGGNEKKGDSSNGGLMPIQMPAGMGGGNTGKKGNGGVRNMNNSGKNDEGMLRGENGNNGNKNGSCVGSGNLESNNGNDEKKGNPMLGGVQAMNQMGGHHHGMGRGNMGPMVNMNMPIGSMSNMNMPMGPMGNIPTIQGPPARVINGGSGHGVGDPKGCLQGVGTESMMGNPFHQQQKPQQQYVAAMMNQQRAIGMENGNDQRFQPMVYAQPPPVINYMLPQQYPYPYPPPQQDPYTTSFFNDENTSSCNIM